MSARLVARLIHRLAEVAGPSDSLHGLLPDQILTAGLGRDREDVFVLPLQALDAQARLGNDADRALVDRDALPLVPRKLLLRIAMAQVAPHVAAVDAHLVGAEGRLAAVARPVNAHADRLLHALGGGGRDPILGLELDAVSLGELLGLFLFGRRRRPSRWRGRLGTRRRLTHTAPDAVSPSVLPVSAEGAEGNETDATKAHDKKRGRTLALPPSPVGLQAFSILSATRPSPWTRTCSVPSSSPQG